MLPVTKLAIFIKFAISIKLILLDWIFLLTLFAEIATEVEVLFLLILLKVEVLV